MMKFLLNPQLGLRGWLRMPRVLFNIKNNSSLKTLSKKEFETLIKCDGEHDLTINETLNDLLSSGIVLENIENGKLLERQKYKFYNNRHFKTARWGITGRCNYKCRHCFMAKDSLENSNDHLSREKCLDIANQIADCGIEDVILTGGEPLVRKDFFDIVDELLKRNVRINAINTNGSFINKDFINKIKRRKIKPAVSVSFDGIGGWHDWLRGVQGAEKEALDAIKLLTENDFYVIAVCCIHQGNIHVLKDTIDLMNTLHVNRVEVYRTAETLRWSLKPNENKALPYKDCYDAYMDLLYTHKKKNWNVEFYLQDFCYSDSKANITQIVPLRHALSCDYSKDYTCIITKNTIFIAPNGQVLPCNAYYGINLKYHFDFENLSDIKLKDILKGSRCLNCSLTTVKDIFDRNKECRNCEYSKKCMGGRCRVIALVSTGDFYGKDESTCAFFQGGYDKKLEKFVSEFKN